MTMDLHMHTHYSDGKDSAEEMIETAIGLGYEAIAITDHVWKTSDWLVEYAAEIRLLAKRYQKFIRVLCGYEAKVINLDGDIDADPSFDALVDLRLGAFHRIPNASGYYSRSQVQPRDHAELVAHWFVAFANMLRNPRVDIIAHPLDELHMFGVGLKEPQMEAVAQLLAEAGKLIEINIRHHAPSAGMLNLLREKGVRFVIGSDSHSTDDLRRYSEALKEVWARPDLVHLGLADLVR